MLRPALAALALALFSLPVHAQGPPGQVGSIMTEAGPVSVMRVADRIPRPWAMTFLPDGRMLVTSKSGKLLLMTTDDESPVEVKGTPTVFAQGQGGLLDVALDPDFGSNGYVYLSFARPGPDGSAATAVGRGRMVADDSLAGFETLFTQEPYITGPNHFGGRIAFGPDGMLYLTMGERFQFSPAQNPENHLGSLVRLMPDGSVPDDNPFVDGGGQDEIWSYGHRNVESAAFDPRSGELWVAEMGPLGGDELNRIQRGANYGWPTVSWGINYDGTEIPDPPTRPEFADAATHWTPVISPSGMTYYDGSLFPEWTGSFFIGSLSRQGVVRVAVDGDRVAEQEVLALGERIREVEAGPDGHLYVLTDQEEGQLWRLEPLGE